MLCRLYQGLISNQQKSNLSPLLEPCAPLMQSLTTSYKGGLMMMANGTACIIYAGFPRIGTIQLPYSRCPNIVTASTVRQE